MWWDLYKQSKARISRFVFHNPKNIHESFTDADRGILLLIALVATPVVIAVTFMVGLST